MKLYIQPTISNNPEYILLHCGTNDLRQDISAGEIGKKIMEVAVSCKSDNNNALVSGIVPFHDKLNAKVTQVNIHLKYECNRNICFIDNSNINPRYNCNKSCVHLNRSGTNKLIENMLFALSKFDY